MVDASTVVGAALKVGSTPDRAVLLARAFETICMSPAVEDEIRSVLSRAKFRAVLSDQKQREIMNLLVSGAGWCAPQEQVTDGRDPKDNKYLELALAAGAAVIVSSDHDLLALRSLARDSHRDAGPICGDVGRSGAGARHGGQPVGDLPRSRVVG